VCVCVCLCVCVCIDLWHCLGWKIPEHVADVANKDYRVDALYRNRILFEGAIVDEFKGKRQKLDTEFEIIEEYICDGCSSKIPTAKKRFRCGACLDYDLCLECSEKKTIIAHHQSKFGKNHVLQPPV